MLLLLLQNNWILPELKQVKSFIIPLYHLVWYSPNLMHRPVMIKLRSWLGNSIFTTGLVLDHWFIYVVLWMVDALLMKIIIFNSVRLLHIQLVLWSFIPEKSLSWWIHKLCTFINTSTFLKFRNLHFIYHMYAFLERITVKTCAPLQSSFIFSSFFVTLWLYITFSIQFCTPNPIWVIW